MRGAKRSATEALLRLPTPVAQPLLARMRPSSGKYAVFVVLKGSDPLQRHALNPTLPRAAHKRKLIDTCHARQRANSVFRMTAATICWWQRSSRRLLRSTTETCGDGDAFPGVRLSGIHCLESSKCWASRCACSIATLQSMDLNHWSERLRLASYLEQAPRSCVLSVVRRPPPYDSNPRCAEAGRHPSRTATLAMPIGEDKPPNSSKEESCYQPRRRPSNAASSTCVAPPTGSTRIRTQSFHDHDVVAVVSFARQQHPEPAQTPPRRCVSLRTYFRTSTWRGQRIPRSSFVLDARHLAH